METLGTSPSVLVCWRLQGPGLAFAPPCTSPAPHLQPSGVWSHCETNGEAFCLPCAHPDLLIGEIIVFKKPCASEGILRSLWRETTILLCTKQAQVTAAANFTKFWPRCGMSLPFSPNLMCIHPSSPPLFCPPGLPAHLSQQPSLPPSTCAAIECEGPAATSRSKREAKGR